MQQNNNDLRLNIINNHYKRIIIIGIGPGLHPMNLYILDYRKLEVYFFN